MKEKLLNQIKDLATKNQTSVSIKQMVQFGISPKPYSLYRGAQFLRNELPIRLSHRVVELENLPHGLSNMPSVLKSCEELLAFPEVADIPEEIARPSKLYNNFHDPKYEQYSAEMVKYNNNFIPVIDNIKRRHAPTTETMARGVLELKEHWKKTDSPLNPGNDKDRMPLPTAIQSFLDNFYMSRIGIRMLIGQHVTISQQSSPQDYVGIICTRTKVCETIENAVAHAQILTQEYYGLFEPPKVKVINKEISDNFMYVPSHLHHMLFELLKNSMRAVVEHHNETEEFPEIKVVVAEGKEDITIKISDEGGGIPRSGIPLIWTYMYTTADSLLEDDTKLVDRVPLAGFGYGLPISRLYARYFGGDLRLISMEGYGTDAYLHLSKLSDSNEPLP